MQGVIRTFDPGTGEGVVVRDTDQAEIVLAADALEGSIFRMLRQGQRVNFELDAAGAGDPDPDRLRARHGPPAGRPDLGANSALKIRRLPPMGGLGGLGTEECPVEDQGAATAQAPGWDADPYGRHELRYWDGAEWTDHVSDAGVTATDQPERMSPWAAMAAVSEAPETEAETAPAPAPVATPTPVTVPAAPSPTPAPVPAPAPRPAPSSAPAPSPAPAAPAGARPAGPSWAWDAPVTRSPTAVPPPAWGPPPGPSAPPRPPIGAYPDGTQMPKRSRRPRWWMVAAICLVVIVGGGYVIFRPPGRIDADPPAATPAGFKLVNSSDYRFAVPSSWASREITSEDQDRVVDELDSRAPGLGEKADAGREAIEGSMTIAADLATRDSVNVIPYHWMRGDPSDPDTLEELRDAIDPV